MRPGRHAAAIILLCVLAACGDPPAPPTTDPPDPNPPPGGETITGREPIGWTQPATDLVDLGAIRYAIYVDGARRVLETATCGATAGAGGFDCSSPLPSLGAGAHVLELASFVTSGGAVLESARSTPLRVTVVATLTAADAEAFDGATLSSASGVRLRAEIVARGLTDPSDLAVAADGRVFVAERAGRVWIGDRGALRDPEAVRVADVAVDTGAGLAAIALDPSFETTQVVFLVYTARREDGASFRILRLREAGGTLAQAALVAELTAPPTRASAAARFGPDDRLYVALGAGPDPRDAQDPTSPFGKILRLNADGTTPTDNPGASPVFSLGHRDLRGLAWHPRTRLLWAVEQDDPADEVNAILPGGNYGWPLVRGNEPYPNVIAPAFSLRTGTGVSGASFVRGSALDPLAGDLLVAAAGAQDLLRVRVGTGGRRIVAVEPLLGGKFGRIGAVASGPDGVVYFSTANRDIWGEGRDLLVRLTAER